MARDLPSTPRPLEPDPRRRSPVRTCVLGLLLAVLGLCALHLLTQWMMNRAAVESIVRYDLPTYRLRFRLLNLDREMSVPAWFSSMLLAATAGLMLLAGWAQGIRKEPGRAGWLALAVFFLVLSIDETAAIHEVMVNRAQAAMGAYATGLLFYAWYVPVLGLGLVLLLALAPFLRKLPRRTARLLAVGILLYLLGAVGFESLMGLSVEPTGTDEPPLQNPAAWFVLLVVLEESFEMLGLVFLVGVMLDYLAPRIQLSVSPPTSHQ